MLTVVVIVASRTTLASRRCGLVSDRLLLFPSRRSQESENKCRGQLCASYFSRQSQRLSGHLLIPQCVGIATTSAGVLLTAPVQSAIGLSGGAGGIIAALSLAYISPVFTTFLVTQVSGIPLSENKYDKRYGDRKDYQEWKKNTPKFFPKIFS